MTDPKIIPDVIILCGGAGTRFLPVDNTIPKALAPIQGRPFLDWQLDFLEQAGIKKVIFATGKGGNFIEAYLQQNPRDEMTYVFSRELQPLGTAGAIKNAQKKIQSEVFFVLNGDSYAQLDLANMFLFQQQFGHSAVLAATDAVFGERFGTLYMNPDTSVSHFSEKNLSSDISDLVYKVFEKNIIPATNAGIYLFKQEILGLLPKNQFYSLEKDLLPGIATTGNLFCYLFHQPFFDIGTPESYLEINRTGIKGIRSTTK